jgi:beta-N-acetylglucosaminidase
VKIHPVGYLLISITIVGTLLLLIFYQAELIRTQENELGEVCRLQEIERRYHLLKAELIKEQEARGGESPSATNMPINTRSGLTAEDLDLAFNRIGASGMEGTGIAFVEAERVYGTNALILAGIAHLESGGGNSYYARSRNNLCGLGAYTDSPNNAFQFDNKAASIFYLAELLSTHYVEGGKYYGGSYSLDGVGIKYAEDPVWAQKVGGRMLMIIQGGENLPNPPLQF